MINVAQQWVTFSFIPSLDKAEVKRKIAGKNTGFAKENKHILAAEIRNCAIHE
jgi:hypothetical protein